MDMKNITKDKTAKENFFSGFLNKAMAIAAIVISGILLSANKAMAVTVTTTVVANVACNGGHDGVASADGSDGTAPYTYSWSNGATGSTVTGLSAGTYTVTVTDDAHISTSAVVTITQPSPITISGVVTNVSCNGWANGNIAVTISGCPTGATYLWSNGQTTQSAYGLSAGSYTLVVSAGSCSASATFTVGEPGAITVSGSVTNASCYGCSNGSVSTSVSGGVSPYTYDWSNGATTANISGVPAGGYLLTVTDNQGCNASGYFSVSQPCPCMAHCSGTGLKTITQGGWGAPPHGGNPGHYMTTHFAAVFPSGLTVGCTNHLTLTSAAAVTAFLPSGGTPAALPGGTLTNPTSYHNTLAGQLVALTLTTGFDNAGIGFSSSSTRLVNMVVAAGPMAGMTVGAVMTEANKVLGGCSSTYSASTLTTVLDLINSNYDEGSSNKGFLICPTTHGKPSAGTQSVDEPEISMFPNPFSSSANITFSLPAAGHATLDVYDAVKGSRVATLFSGDVKAGTEYTGVFEGGILPPGVYIYKLTTNDNAYFGKAVLVK